MSCPNCGCTEFETTQRTSIGPDTKANFIRNIASEDEASLYIEDHDNPRGPFTCYQCREVYDEIPKEES